MPSDDDEILLPKKSKAGAPRSSKGPSPQMVRLIRITRGVGVLLGGFVTLVGVMGVVGLVTDNFWARLVIAALVVIGLPAFLADRALRRGGMGGGLGAVADVFAIVLLGIALVLVAADVVTRRVLVREGDRYARSGSTGMARVVYFLAGVSPVFPGDKAAGASGAASGSASSSASASAPAKGTK